MATCAFHSPSLAGNLIGDELVATDVTDRRRLEDQLRQSQKMEAIGRLAGGVAHDFNNILGVIMGHGELAQRQLGSAHPARPRVDEMVQAAERGAALTRQLLAFSRKQVLAPRVLNLNDCVAEVDKLLPRIQEKIQKSYPGTKLAVTASDEMITRITNTNNTSTRVKPPPSLWRWKSGLTCCWWTNSVAARSQNGSKSQRSVCWAFSNWQNSANWCRSLHRSWTDWNNKLDSGWGTRFGNECSVKPGKPESFQS